MRKNIVSFVAFFVVLLVIFGLIYYQKNQKLRLSAEQSFLGDQEKSEDDNDISIDENDITSTSTASNTITFSRKIAGYITPPSTPKVDPSRGYYGLNLNKDQKDKIEKSDYLSIDQEIIVDDISFKITGATLSEKNGNFADNDDFAPYNNVYVVVTCDVRNCNKISKRKLSSKYFFNLIEGCNNLFSNSKVYEKEYYSYYDDIAPDTEIIGATLSFYGSRSLLTNSNNIILELICDNQPVAYWKIDQSLVK